MSNKYPGGLVTLNPPAQDPALGAATNGVWTMDQALNAETNRSWPMYDPYYNNVVLNLHGNGTNGAQNNTFLDSSSNNFTITRNGNTTQGAFNPYQQNGYWSNYFDGSSNIVGSLSSALGTGDFTVEFWVYIVSNTGTSGEGGFLQTTSSSTGLSTSEYGVSSLTMQRNSGTNTYGFAVGGTSVPFSNSGTYLNQWMHIACVRSSGTVRIYMNGVLNSTPTTATTNLTGTYIGIGGYYNGNYLINAYIANFRATSTVVYSSNFTPPTTPLTAITGTLFLGCQSNRFLNTSSGAAMTINTGSPKVQTFTPLLQNLPYEPSRLGGSGYFDGSGDYLSVASNSAFGFGTGDFTVECWVYPVSWVGASDGFISTLNSGTAVGVQISRDGVEVNGVLTTWGSSLSLNTWTHLALTRSGTSLKLFLNGAVSNSTTNSANIGSSSALAIGRRLEDYNGYYCNAYISNARVLKGTAVYTGAFTPPTLAPLATSGASSAACYSSTTNVNTSFASSACSLLTSMTNAGIYDSAMMNDLETVNGAQISTTQKKYGTASMYFDGTGDYLTVASAAQQNFKLGTGDFTIEFWAWKSANGVNGYDGVIGVTPSTGGSPYWFVELSSSRGFRMNVGAVGCANSTTTGINDSTWHHWAICRSGTTWYIFKDGTALTKTFDTGGSANIDTAAIINIGREIDTNTSFDFNGYIDDFRITKGYARYTSNFTPPTSQLQDQ